VDPCGLLRAHWSPPENAQITAFPASVEVALFGVSGVRGNIPLYRIEKRPRLRQKQGANTPSSDQDGAGSQARARPRHRAARFWNAKLIRVIDAN